MSDGLKSNVKLFADDTSLFSVAKKRKKVPVIKQMTLIRFPNGYINGICHSVQTPKNTRERYYSLEKLKCNSSNYLPHQCSGTKAFRDILHKKLNSKCHTDQVIMKTSKGITVIKRI